MFQVITRTLHGYSYSERVLPHAADQRLRAHASQASRPWQSRTAKVPRGERGDHHGDLMTKRGNRDQAGSMPIRVPAR